jgi:Pyruvate/2-oxoacid:ferredoxin oxidoreductase delta subunit
VSIVDASASTYDEEHHALVDPEPSRSRPGGWGLRLGLPLIVLGLLAFLVGIAGQQGGRFVLGLVGFGAIAVGAAATFVAVWAHRSAASNNDRIFFRSAQSQGLVAWALGVGMTGFYVVLYWFPGRLERVTHLLDPLARLLAGRAADHWFLYGFVYTVAVLVFGVRMLAKHRGNPYQLWRTASLMAFQFGFAFLLPHLMELAHQPEFYFTYFWPLKWSYLFPSGVSELRAHPGGLGVFLLAWTAIASLVATPVLTYYFGKRWYCSWVCGCGGLAETLGDPFRQLSSKSSRAWRIERVSIYAVLGFIVLTTSVVWLHASGHAPWLGGAGQRLSNWYGFFIGSVFSGVVGVGFYPLLGSRVWCRFGCPMAAVLGLQQRLWSRFRITTNGGQCISCGNCSTYCEMGIDVRAYAQKGENIVRASCVGCGVCSAVCPRGVLKLENGRTHADRVDGPGDPWTRLLAEIPSQSTEADQPQCCERHS